MKEISTYLSKNSVTHSDMYLYYTVENKEAYVKASKAIREYYEDHKFFGKDGVASRLNISKQRLSMAIDPEGYRAKRLLSTAINHPFRKKIIKLLEINSHTVEELSELLDSEESYVLQNLIILQRVKVVLRDDKNGQYHSSSNK